VEWTSSTFLMFQTVAESFAHGGGAATACDSVTTDK
jgi:hypothetical protein